MWHRSDGAAVTHVPPDRLLTVAPIRRSGAHRRSARHLSRQTGRLGARWQWRRVHPPRWAIPTSRCWPSISVSKADVSYFPWLQQEYCVCAAKRSRSRRGR
jgi:hypothetical protein